MLTWWERDLNKRLAEGEKVLITLHEHWIRLAQPLGIAVAANVAAVLIASRVLDGPDQGQMRLWVLLGGLAVFGWFAVQVVDWYTDYFVVSSKRLINVKGLIRRQFAIMPLSAVTDMDYVRSVPGKILGYGQFQIESAGQKQAIDLINWVPRSDEVYRIIMNELFGVGSPVRPKVPLTGSDLPIVEPGDPYWLHGD